MPNSTKLEIQLSDFSPTLRITYLDETASLVSLDFCFYDVENNRLTISSEECFGNWKESVLKALVHPFLDLNKYFWYYCCGWIKHDSSVSTIEEAESSEISTRGYREACYTIPDAVRWGFAPSLKGLRSISKGEMIQRLTTKGLICTDSPLSLTPIRIKCKNNLMELIKEITSTPVVIHDYGIDDSGYEYCDLWSWPSERPHKNQ